MKRVVCIISILLSTLLSFSQTQQGFVKTQGRPNKPGKPLSGVTIRWRGEMNAVISGQDGKFNTFFKDKKNGDAIGLLSVRKKDFELIDKDLTNRSLVFSTKVPIEIVMVSSAELEANRKRISDNAYQKAEETFQNRLKILKKQKNESDITVEQYSQKLKELQDNYEKYVALIDGMADRYARTDYDHLDSIDREINICIENGELEKADSLIHTVFDPSTVLERNRAAKAEIQARMKLAQDIIDKANADKAAIIRDSDYAKRVISLCDILADEYILQDNKEKARECLMQSLNILKFIYSEEHEKVKQTKQKIQSIQ